MAECGSGSSKKSEIRGVTRLQVWIEWTSNLRIDLLVKNNAKDSKLYIHVYSLDLIDLIHAELCTWLSVS